MKFKLQKRQNSNDQDKNERITCKCVCHANIDEMDSLVSLNKLTTKMIITIFHHRKFHSLFIILYASNGIEYRRRTKRIETKQQQKKIEYYSNRSKFKHFFFAISRDLYTRIYQVQCFMKLTFKRKIIVI